MNRLKSILAACSRTALAGIFWIAVRLFYDVEFRGLEHVSGEQPVYFAMAHKRDLDPIVEVPTVLAHRGWWALVRDVRFAMRSDAFSQGFLARIVMHPRWFARILRPLSVRAIVRHLGIRPLENLHGRPAETWIRDWLRREGDGPAGDILTSAFLQEMATSVGEDYQKMKTYQLSHLLSWHYQESLQPFYSADIFAEPARGRAKNDVLIELKQQLAVLGAWLSSGGSLWGAPEGQLSPHGTLSPITAALYRVLRVGPPDTCVVPIFIIYDFMTARRPRIFVDVAPAIERAVLLSPQELGTQLRHAWLLNARFTCTQLASGFLVQASRAAVPSFTPDDLAREIGQQAVTLAAAGRQVDRRLFYPRTARKLAAAFLKYAVRHKLVQRIGRRTWIPTIGELVIQVRPGEVGYRQAPLAYAWNELQEMLGAGRIPTRGIPTMDEHPRPGVKYP